MIRQNLPAATQEMAPEEAINAGAVALFGEKYGDRVRVLTLGKALAGEGAYSVELCGGTHVARTGDIALFKIVVETGVAASALPVLSQVARPLYSEKPMPFTVWPPRPIALAGTSRRTQPPAAGNAPT